MWWVWFNLIHEVEYLSEDERTLLIVEDIVIKSSCLQKDHVVLIKIILPLVKQCSSLYSEKGHSYYL